MCVCVCIFVNIFFCYYYYGENTILFPKFWDHKQIGHCYFQFTINLAPTINSLTENVCMANGVYSWTLNANVVNKKYF